MIGENIDLAAYSTFGISSRAKELIHVKNSTELLLAIKKFSKENIPYRVIGSGSNLVLPDSGIEDPVIQIRSSIRRIEHELLISESGVLLSDLVNDAIENDLAGLEYLSGIPGTVGGAVVGNAGAYGRSMSDVIDSVEVWNGKDVITFLRTDCGFSYRNSIFKEKPFVILRVKIKLMPRLKENLRDISEKIIKLRKEKYLPGVKCPGSFFKNIPVIEASEQLLGMIDSGKIKGGKIPAGYLLESVGAKGIRCNDIQVSEFHGNLIINRGNGKSADVRKLADILKRKVKSKFGIWLEEEVMYF